MEGIFRKQVKEVLEHLYDTAYLECHPLLPQFAPVVAVARTTRAQKLRSLIKDSIEGLRPQQGSPSTSPEWRSYLALRYRYVQGMPMAQVENELGISLRQLQRELHKGIEALCSILWELREPGAGGEGGETAIDQGEVKDLEDELSQWVLNRQPVELQALIDDVLWMLSATLAKKQTRLLFQAPVEDIWVLVDGTLMRQALYKALQSMAEVQTDEIRISNTLDAQRISLCFEFEQSFSPQTEADWQIAQMLVEQQGGALEIQSSEMCGRVLLTMARVEQKSVLVVDDNSALHHLFERYLAPLYYTLHHAYNGPEALQLARSVHPDLITLDVMMPSMDGWQVLRELRGEESLQNIPIVVCSVLKEPDLALSLGASAYLKKPVDRLQLQQTLEALLKG